MIFCKFLAVSPEIVPAPESHRSVASLSSSQTPYQSFPCKHEKLFHFVAPHLPKKQMLFGDPTVFAKSYHFQTVIQLSRCIKTKKSSPPMNRGKDFYRRYHARQTKKHRRNKYRLPLFLSSYGAWVVNINCSAYALQSY